MSQSLAPLHINQSESQKATLGFWVYLMTDCILFASLFATYAVLRNNTFGGESAADLFDLSYILIGTLALLVSSFTCGLAVVAAWNQRRNLTISLLTITSLLGLLFLGMEIYEFSGLVNDGNSWQRSGFLSAYFTLLGTHGLHVAIGIIWALVLLFHIVSFGISQTLIKRLTFFSLFWHFLDVIWIFIFTFVYLMGRA